MRVINPSSLAQPKGYSHGVILEGKLLFVSGQVGWNAKGELAVGFTSQFERALQNALEIVQAANGDAMNIGRLTIYVKSKQEYIQSRKELGTIYRSIMGNHYPAMTLIEVKDLLEEGAMVEIEATAVLP